MAEQEEEVFGENALTKDEVGGLIAEALDGLQSKGITSAVLVVLVENGPSEYCRISYRGSPFRARGLIGWAMDWIRSETSPPEAEGENDQ